MCAADGHCLPSAECRVSDMTIVSKLLRQMERLADIETKKAERNQIRRQRKNEARRKSNF